MADEGRRIPYIIEMIADDHKIKQQLSKWDWEDIIGVKGKGFSDILVSDAKDAKDQITRTLGSLNLNWKDILGADDLEVFEQGLARVIQGAKREIQYFGDKKDTAGIERTMQYLSALGEEFASIGSTFDAKQIARSMNSLMGVLNTLEVSAERLKTSFTTLFTKGTATSLNTIATAMASIGVDKSQITSMKRAREEMEKLAKSSTITLDIDYSSLSTDDLLKALRGKHKAQKLNLSDLLEYEWSDVTQALPDIYDADARKKQLWAILKLEERFAKELGKSPVNEFFEEDTGLFDMSEVKEEFNELTKASKKAAKETLEQFKQSAKDIKDAIAEEFEKLANVKVNLILDDANKKSFAQSVNDFITEFNEQKHGTVEPVKIDLIPNEPEKTTKRGRPLSASKEQIKIATSEIQEELERLQKEYDEVDNVLNNFETGLRQKIKPDKPNTTLNKSIDNAEAKLKALEKQMISYKYILSNMDDYEFAKHIASDWKRFASAEEVILASQNKLLDRTQKWRNEMNNLLRFRYTWKVEGTEDEFAGLESALIDLTDNHPIRLTPDIDFLANAIEEGLAKKQINVKLAADGPVNVSGVVGNLGALPIMVAGQPHKSSPIPVTPVTPTPKVASQPQPQPKEPTPPQTVTKSYTDVDTDITTIIEFVEEQVENNKKLRGAYAELLKDLGITDEGVSAFLDNVKKGKATIPQAIASKHGSEELLLQKLRRQKEDVSFNSKNPFFTAANDILKLKDVIANNPDDQAKVQEASDQIKSLLMKSIVDSFKNYFKTSAEDKNKYSKEIKAQESARAAALAKYNSEPEKQKRNEIIASKQRAIDELQSNTAIAEYESLLARIEEARTKGDATSLKTLQEQERQTLPAIKQGYQELIKLKQQLQDNSLYQITETEHKISELEAKTNKTEREVQALIRLREHLSTLQWENADAPKDARDANLVATRQAQEAINEKKSRIENIDRRREAYDTLFSLDKIKELIDSADTQGLSDFIIKEILSKSDIAERMSRHKKTHGGETNSIKAFDTMSQRLITATVDLVQKALGIAQEATDDLGWYEEKEKMLGDIKEISKRKRAVDSMYGWGTIPKSESEFTELKDLFKEDFQYAQQAESSKTATDRDRAYIRFANALDEATEAAEAYRTVYNEWTDEERSELLSVGDKEAWFKQKYQSPEEATRNYQLYTNYNKAVDTLKESVNKPRDASGNTIGEGVSHDLKRQLQGYVFRVTLVDQNGATVTTGVGTQRLVEAGKLSKPNKSYKADSRDTAIFLSSLDPSKAQDIKVYRYPNSRGGKVDQPVVDTPTSPTKPKTETTQVIRQAKQTINIAKRVVDESQNMITAQEELESANSALSASNQNLEATQRRMAAITGGKDADEYIQSLRSEKQQPKTVVQNKIDNVVKPLSNALFEETNKTISDETENIARAILIDNNPLDAIKIPNIAKRIMEIANERRTLKGKPQNEVTKAQLQKLREEENALMAPWKNSSEARQLIFGDIQKLDSLNEKLRKTPDDANLKTEIEQLRVKIAQRMKLYEGLLGTLPKEVYQLSDIVKEKDALNNSLPKDIEEANAIQRRVQELSQQEQGILQSVHQWKDNIKQQGQTVIDSAFKEQEEQGAPALAQDYQKQIGELISQAMSLSAQFEANPNNEELKTKLQGIVNAISQLTLHYRELLEQYNVYTQGFLGNEGKNEYQNALQIFQNAGNKHFLSAMELWSGLEIPESVHNREELLQKESELMRLIPTLPKDQQELMQTERQKIAEDYNKENAKVLQWVNGIKGVVGTGIFEGLSEKDGRLKAVTDLRAKLFGTKVETTSADTTNTTSTSQLFELKALKAQEAAQKLAIENGKERVALAERRLAIEQELADAAITAERRAELTAEHEANRNRAAELGVRAKKFANIQTDPAKLQEAYVEVVNAYIDQQQESDAKIAELQSEIATQYNRLGALKAPRTEEAVKEGKRRTQNRAIESVIKQKAENLVTTDPDDYARIVELVEDEISVTDFYDRMNPYAAYDEELARRIQKKSEEYVREMISLSPAEQQRIVDEAIAMQEEAIKVKEAELAAERARNNQIVTERDKYKTEGKVTDEMIAARRDAIQAIRQEAQFVQKTVEEVIATEASQPVSTPIPIPTSSGTSDVHYQNYTSGQAYQYGGGVYGIDTSLLATEETLNAIYTLLSGDTSRSGMSDAQRKALEAELEVIRSQTANGPLGRNNDGDDVPPITPMNRRTAMDDLRMADEAENAAKLLHGALSELDPRHSSVDVLIDAYKNLGQEVLDAEKLLLNPEYAGALETAQIASMGIENFPDVDELLRKLKYLRARVGSDTIEGIDAQKKPVASKPTEIKPETTSVVKPQESQKTAESLMTIGKAINIINKAIGESTAKTATGMAKAYENKIHGNAEVVEAAKLLYNTPDSDLRTKHGKDVKSKLKAFRDAWANKQANEQERSKAMQELEKKQWETKTKVPVEPEIAPGAVAQEVKENVAQTPAQAPITPTVDNKSTDIRQAMSDGMEARIARANALSKAGLKVGRSRLLLNGDEAFNKMLGGDTLKNVIQDIIWPKIVQQLKAVGLSTTEEFNAKLASIADNSVWKSKKASSWLHFATPEGKFNGPLTKKAYGSFANIGNLSSELINQILTELSAKGFKGQIKIPSDITGFYDTDQIVGHAVDDDSFRILVDTLQQLVNSGVLSSMATGVDANTKVLRGKKGASFTQLIEEIYAAAPGQTFSVQEIKTIITAMLKDASGKFEQELVKPIVDDVISKRVPIDNDIIRTTLPDGSPFEGTKQEYNDLMAWLSGESVEVDVKPTVQPEVLDQAINEVIANNPPEASIVKADFADGTHFEGTEAELQEMIAMFGEPISKMVEASNQQLQNEQAKKEETAEQLKNEQTESNIQITNTEALKAREVELVAMLEADDKLKAAQSSDNTSGGGLIGAIGELAKESTLVKVLQALGEIAKRQVASVSGKGNSAQDLLVRLQKMLALGIDQKKERVAYMDLATGAMTDSVEGSHTIVDPATFEALRNAYRDAVNFNAQVHTHADESDPYFSQADLKQFVNDATIGIKKQILLSRDSMTVLDMEGAQDVEGLLNALMTTEHTFEALSNTAAQFGATYLNSSFNDMTPQGLVKMLGIKGVESKYTEEETRESAVKGMLAEDAKVAADMLQESTGRAVKRTVERVGAELMTTTEKIDAKGNKTWSKQISDKYTKAAWATNEAFAKLGLDKEFGVGTDAQLALTEYTNRYAEFVQLTEEFKKNPNKEGLQAQFNELLPKLDEAEEKLNKLIQTKDKFLGNKEAIGIFDHTQVASAGDNLKALATQRYAQGGIGIGENIAFNGISDTQFGTRLLVDVLKNGVIKQYALEVDKATGNVKEFMLSETALANAFQNVNKAMRYNETVMAKVAIGDNPTQQEAFMNSAKSPEWNAYKKALGTMEKYVANIWNRMAQGGRGASQKELDYIMTLSENVLELGKNVSKTSGEFKTFWEQNPSDVTALNIKIKKRGKNVPSRDEQVRAEMEKLAQTKANASGQRYAFSSFDNDVLKYKLIDLEGNIRHVTMVWSALYGQAATISDKSISEVDALTGKVEKLKNKFEEAEAVGYLNGDNKDLEAFKKQLEDIDNAVKNGDTFENIEAMRRNAIALGDRITKVVNQTKGMMVGTGAKKSVDNQYDKIVGAMQGLPDEWRPDFGAENNAQVVQQYIDAYKQLNQDYQKYVDNNKINNPKIQQQLKQQAVHVQMLGKKLLSSATQASKLNDLVEQSGFYVDKNTGEEINLGGVTSVTAQELSNLEGKMRDYVQNGLRQANIEGVKFDAVNQRMTYTFRTSKNTVSDMVVQYNKATKALYAYQKQEHESLTGLAGFLQTMKVKTRSILQYVTSMTSIYRVWGMLRQGVQYIKEIDLALVELRKVTNETEATYNRFLQTASKTAGKLGSTISAVTEATATFAKLGYTIEQASEMAEAAIVYKNVGDNIASTEDAADSIISTLKGFGLEASETMRIVDRFNEVKPASLYSDVYDKGGYIGKTLETDNSEERFKSVN